MVIRKKCVLESYMAELFLGQATTWTVDYRPGADKLTIRLCQIRRSRTICPKIPAFKGLTSKSYYKVILMN